MPLNASTLTSMARGMVAAQPTTIQHWQLRDLVQCERAHEAHCVHGQEVVRYDGQKEEGTIVQQLKFSPTSMTVSHGYVVSGGSRSELHVTRQATGETIFSQLLGGNVNNALHVGRDQAGNLKLFVCNNDDTIKVFSLPDMALAATIMCSVPINYCALSPDGRSLACVGDNNDVHLYRCSHHGDQFLKIKRLSEAHDHGMSVAWNPSGSCFAAASQDGLVCVWDVRSQRPMAKFSTSLACRSLKFSRGPVDLLAFAEHEENIHLVDARTFATRQTIRVGSPGMDSSNISGIAFFPDGSHIYAGLDDSISLYEIDTSMRRSFPQGCLI